MSSFQSLQTKYTGEDMENYEVTIIGDGREAVVSAQSAGTKYKDKNILILVSDIKCFIKKVCSHFYFKLEKTGQDEFNLLLNGNKIKVIVDEAVDRKGHWLNLKTGRTIWFEKLILAQGCRCPNLSIEGLDKKGVYFLQSDYNQLLNIKRNALRSEDILIFGGSYLGVKLADELLNYSKKVTIVEKSAWLFPETIDLSLGREVKELLMEQGCRVILNRKLRRIKGDQKIISVELSDGETIRCDILLISCKNKPEIGFAQRLGLICDSDRGILVDEYCRTSEKDIYAIGECAAHFEFFRGDLADAILSSTYELEGMIVGSNLYSVIYNREKMLENLYSLNTVN